MVGLYDIGFVYRRNLRSNIQSLNSPIQGDGSAKEMNAVLIRTAKIEDVNEIVQLCAEHAEHEKAEFNSTGKASKLKQFLFSDNPRLYCLIAEVEGKSVGYATYMDEFSTWDANYYVHMDCLFIRPAYRGFGLGERLVIEVVRYATREGRQVIQWQTPRFNTRALKFYHRIGATSREKFRMFLDSEAQKNLLSALSDERNS